MSKNELMARLSAAVGSNPLGEKILKEVEKDGSLISKENFETQIQALQKASQKYQAYADEEMLAYTNQKIEIFQQALNILEGED